MLRDFLDRFRPAGAPGAAGVAGIPADRRAGAEQELAPLFAALAGVERDCAEMRDRSQRSAAWQTAQSQRMANAILARARSQTAAVRAAAAADAQAAADAERQGIQADASVATAELRTAAQRLVPALVDQIVARAGELAESVTAEQP